MPCGCEFAWLLGGLSFRPTRERVRGESGRMSKPREERLKQVLPAEDLSAEVEELLSLAAERGRLARTTAQGRRGRSSPVATTHPDKADIAGLLRDELRQVLE